jgi:hypothetical protein
MSVFDVEIAAQILDDLIDRAKMGEEILIRDGDTIVKMEPIRENIENME